MRVIGGRGREAILAESSLGELARTIEAGGDVPGLPEWDCIATPGHTPGHLAYFRRRDRVLISGDAVVTLRLNSFTGFAPAAARAVWPPWSTTWSRRAAAESIRALARLEPSVLASGYGRPMMVPEQRPLCARSPNGEMAETGRDLKDPNMPFVMRSGRLRA
jgi:glyoxylase-like metal-dependent hydrolase (beta-lactamase superfamily II)